MRIARRRRQEPQGAFSRATPSQRADADAEAPLRANIAIAGVDRKLRAIRYDPVITVDLPSALPITDVERKLFALYFGDLVTSILSEPEEQASHHRQARRDLRAGVHRSTGRGRPFHP
jgi:hypothetical protein